MSLLGVGKQLAKKSFEVLYEKIKFKLILIVFIIIVCLTVLKGILLLFNAFSTGDVVFYDSCDVPRVVTDDTHRVKVGIVPSQCLDEAESACEAESDNFAKYECISEEINNNPSTCNVSPVVMISTQVRRGQKVYISNSAGQSLHMCGDVLRVIPVIRSMNTSIWNSNNIVDSNTQHNCLNGLSNVRYIDLWSNRLWSFNNICAWNIRNNNFIDTGLPIIEGDTLYLTWYGSYGIVRDGVATTLPNLAGRSLEERREWFDRTSTYITPLRDNRSTGQITRMYGEELRNNFLSSLGLDGEMQSISQLDSILDNISDPEPRGIYSYRGIVNNYGARNRGDGTTFGISHYQGENQVILDRELVRRLSLIMNRLNDNVLDTLNCGESSCALSEPSVQTLINKVEQYKQSLISLKRTEDQRSVQIRNREDLGDSYSPVPDTVLPDITRLAPRQRFNSLPRNRNSQCFTHALYFPCENDSQCSGQPCLYNICDRNVATARDRCGTVNDPNAVVCTLCRADGDCGNGKTCRYGFCVANDNEFNACLSNHGPDYQYCQDHNTDYCVALRQRDCSSCRSCISDSECNAGQSCASGFCGSTIADSENCATYCLYTISPCGYNNYCRKCRTDDDCGGESCLHGYCESALQECVQNCGFYNYQYYLDASVGVLQELEGLRDSFGDIVGGFSMKLLWKGCSVHNGDRLEYAISRHQPEENSSSWQRWSNNPDGIKVDEENAYIFLRIRPSNIIPEEYSRFATKEKQRGLYNVRVKITNLKKNILSDIFTPMIVKFEKILLGDENSEGVMRKYYNTFIGNPDFINTIRAIIVLVFVLYAVSVLIGTISVSQKELVALAVKIGVVVTIISPTSWHYMDTILIPFFLKSINLFTKIFFEGFIGYEVDSPFVFFYSFINDLNLMLSKMFSSWNKVAYMLINWEIFIFVFVFICIYFVVALKMCLVIIFAFLTVALLLLMTPVVIPCILFKRTRRLFDTWWKYMLSITLQPALTILTVVVIGSFSTDIVISMIDVSVCGNYTALQLSEAVKVDDIKLNGMFTVNDINKIFMLILSSFLLMKLPTCIGQLITRIFTGSAIRLMNLGSSADKAVSK